ncbi:MAG: hypothetical protein RSC78_05215, partial [Acidaminococcaceae bacterium]
MNEIDVIKTYDELHKIPELGFQEFKTATYLADKLEALGYEVTRNIGGTGVIGILRGSEVGPVMLVRADMDALPFVVEGKMMKEGKFKTQDYMNAVQYVTYKHMGYSNKDAYFKT